MTIFNFFIFSKCLFTFYYLKICCFVISFEQRKLVKTFHTKLDLNKIDRMKIRIFFSDWTWGNNIKEHLLNIQAMSSESSPNDNFLILLFRDYSATLLLSGEKYQHKPVDTEEVNEKNSHSQDKFQFTNITELKVVIQTTHENIKAWSEVNHSIASFCRFSGQIRTLKIIFDQYFDTYYTLSTDAAISLWKVLCSGFEQSLEQLCIGSADCLINACNSYEFYRALWFEVLLPQKFCHLFNFEMVPFMNFLQLKNSSIESWLDDMQKFIITHREQSIEQQSNSRIALNQVLQKNQTHVDVNVLTLILEFADYWYGLIHLQLAHHMDIPLHSLFMFSPPIEKTDLEGKMFQNEMHVSSVFTFKNMIQKEISSNFRQYYLHCHGERLKEDMTALDIPNLIKVDSRFPIPVIRCHLSESPTMQLELLLIPPLCTFVFNAFDSYKDPTTGHIGMEQLRLYFISCGVDAESPHVSFSRLVSILHQFGTHYLNNLINGLSLQDFEVFYLVALLNKSIYVWNDFLAYQYDFSFNFVRKPLTWSVRSEDYSQLLTGYKQV
ncbi:hypothetical protein RFI_27609 [Reticulomyxa filosa]|uniref:Uncharacterized protein n=1 Tax=Reticulomyxa filosa TaxID=46433 RepID=X6M9S9_RETFI|nr:hypothetical protein RFI_27609 [Reticulomyxa filosa]|eukprot:ETO09770.1 hypothetical protein RFI_27609 [Reticulomyxa filosa]